MINWIKYKLSKYLLKRMSEQFHEDVDQNFADKWNHLQAIKLTKGRIKWRWNKIIGSKER